MYVHDELNVSELDSSLKIGKVSRFDEDEIIIQLGY
jgi:hypothetical protein